MTTPSGNSHSLPLPGLTPEAHQACDAFEAAWKAAAGPRIEEYLGTTTEPGRSALLRELLGLDLDYRRMAGDIPTLDEYQARFPEHQELVRDAFAEEAPEKTPAALATVIAGAAETRTGSSSPQLPDGHTEGGLVVPGYEIFGELGRGGMGVVYKARQIKADRLVALKMILAGVHADQKDQQRFQGEVEAIARLQHPNIVQIFEVGEVEGKPFFSLEFAQGGSLAHRLDGTPLPAREAALLLETLARAMAVVHQQGIVHRDLKPANVLLSADGQPKISDFGLAKQLDSEEGQTASGVIVGTPSYMAPEQAGGRTHEIGPAADVYALGAILYECLTGRPPFKAATVLETLGQVRFEEPVPPGRLQPGLPRDLETVCLKCLEKVPSKRYATASGLAEDLRRYLNHEPILARPTPLWERGLKWAKRRPMTAALVVASTLALLGLVLSTLLYQHAHRLAAEQELDEHRRAEVARDSVQDMVLKAQEAVAGKRWQEARTALELASATIHSQPTLAGFKEQVERLWVETEQGLAHQQALDTAHDKSRRFFDWRTQALFRGTVFTGVDLPTDLKATTEAARLALDLFGVSAVTMGAPLLDPCFSEREKADLTIGCYELLLILAEAEAQQNVPGKFDRAVHVLDRAAQLGLSTKAYHLRRARYLKQRGDQAGFEKENAAAAKCPTAGALDYFLLGDDLQREGNLLAAIQAYEAALRLQRDHFWAQYFMAICYLRLRPVPELRAAKACLTACLDQEPEFVWLYVLRGFAHGRLNEFKAAEEDFQKGLDLLERRPSEDARFTIWVNRGVLRARQKRVPEAVADLEAAIRLKPDRYQAYLNLANVYQLQNQRAEAAGQFEKAFAVVRQSLQPGQVESVALALVHRSRARFHLLGGDQSAALRDFDQSIQAEPRDSPSLDVADDHAQRGRLLFRTERYAEAVTAYDAALKVRPAYVEVQRGRAEALLQLGRPEEATASFDQYLEHGGKPDADLYRGRGLSRTRLHDYPGAVRDYTQALALSPDSATYAARGWMHLVNDSLKWALHDFEEAIRLDPENGDAYSGRGHARARLGQTEQAVVDADKALQLGPRTPRSLWNAARIYAEVVGALGADKREQDWRTRAARSRNQDRSLQLIDEALGAMPGAERASFWQRYISGDSAFVPIRQCPRFIQLAVLYSRSGN